MEQIYIFLGILIVFAIGILVGLAIGMFVLMSQQQCSGEAPTDTQVVGFGIETEEENDE